MWNIGELHAQFFLRYIITTIIFSPCTRAQLGTITQDITSILAFSQQKTCAQNCFQSSGACPIDYLGAEIGCVTSGAICGVKSWPSKNDCYCRADLQEPAQQWLTSCLQSRCTVGDASIDASSAGSIYNQYCLERGYSSRSMPASTPANPTTSGGDSQTISSSKESTSPNTSTNPFSSTPANASPQSTGISTTTIVGIVVGCLVALVLLVFTTWKILGGYTVNHGISGNIPQILYPRPEEGPKMDQKSSYQMYPYRTPAEQVDTMSMAPTRHEGYFSAQSLPVSFRNENVRPEDSVSSVGDYSRPAPTLVSGLQHRPNPDGN